MVEKELLMAGIAYNLARAAAQAAAQLTGLPARSFSFARIHTALRIWLPYLADIEPPQQRQDACRTLVTVLCQCRLYPRKRTIPYPRAIWSQPRKYPFRKSEAKE